MNVERRGQREIDCRARDMVKVVGEDFECHIGDDLGNVALGVPVLAQSSDVFISYDTSILDDLVGKTQRCRWLR